MKKTAMGSINPVEFKDLSLNNERAGIIMVTTNELRIEFLRGSKNVLEDLISRRKSNAKFKGKLDMVDKEISFRLKEVGQSDPIINSLETAENVLELTVSFLYGKEAILESIVKEAIFKSSYQRELKEVRSVIETLTGVNELMEFYLATLKGEEEDVSS